MISEEQISNSMMQAGELAELMSRNGGKVLDHVDKDEVKHYAWLREHLHDSSLKDNEEFKENFSNTYRLSGRRVSLTWKERLFELMERSKESESFDFFETFHLLYKETSTTKLGPTQFSILSKVASTLDDQFPVFETNVGDLLGFKKPTSTKDTSHERMREYMNFYEHTKTVYSDLAENPKVLDLLKVFKIQHREHIGFLPVAKRLDFLVRSAANLKSKGSMV